MHVCLRCLHHRHQQKVYAIVFSIFDLLYSHSLDASSPSLCASSFNWSTYALHLHIIERTHACMVARCVRKHAQTLMPNENHRLHCLTHKKWRCGVSIPVPLTFYASTVISELHPGVSVSICECLQQNASQYNLLTFMFI